jgi:hypothetical protein
VSSCFHQGYEPAARLNNCTWDSRSIEPRVSKALRRKLVCRRAAGRNKRRARFLWAIERGPCEPRSVGWPDCG